jgi:hypothetical protein
MVTVVDTTPPMLTCGTNKTVACGAPWTFDPPAALDSCCGASVIITLLSTVTNGGPCPMIATRAWKATDCCSNSITCTQTVLVLDKWLQIPDASTNGLDVKATDPKILADDFLCHATGPITKVRIWGSWLNDAVPPPPPCFCLGLWSDIPRSGTNYSRPGQQLCSYCAGPGQYTNFIYTNALFERFYDPNIPGTNGLIGTDTAIWEYVFDIPTNIPCWYQTNGNIYWLSVTADCFPTNQFLFGWKTSPTNWNDDAVYGDSLGFGGPPTNWFALTRPGTTNSLDLAFEITTLTNSCPPPSLVCATNKTVICDAPWSFDPPLVFDACCGTNFTVTTTTFTNGSICPPVVTRFWTVTDCLGSMGFCTQSVTLIVTAPPLLICSNKTVQCGTPFTNDPPKAFSLCCGTNVTIMPLGGTSTAGTCTQVMSQVWQAMDCCGNLSSMCTQTITIVDTTPPTLTCSSNKTVQCGTPWLFDPPTAFDTCCGTNVFIGIVTTFTNGGACTQVVSRVWQAADCCSNLSATCTQAVTVVDTIPPDITCPSNIVMLTCSTNVAVSWSVTAGDACSLVTVTSSPPSGTFFTRDTTNAVTATATDACGNTNSCSFQVIVRRPTITIGIGLGIPPTNVILSWVDGGVLEDATNIVGLWTPRPLATSPYTNAITTVQRFYRLRCP